jgi:hypothetical protein
MARKPIFHPEEQKDLSDQNTMILPSVKIEHDILGKWLPLFPRFLQILILKFIERVSDPAPEISTPNRKQAVKAQARSLGWIPQLSLVGALGMILIAFAFSNSRNGGIFLNVLFYPSLMLIFAPIAVRILSPIPSRIERAILLSMIGFYCYLIKFISSPSYFYFYDEFLHMRSVNDILQNGHLFNINTLLPVSPYYPGLEIVTNALCTLSGLDTFTSGIIIIGVAHFMLTLALFALYEQIVKSSRIASIAVAIYITNPHFMFFDSQYGYESLALPFAVLILFLLAYQQTLSIRNTRLQSLSSFINFVGGSSSGFSNDLRALEIVVWIILVALVVTHHVTDFFLDGLLLLWMIVGAIKRLGFSFDRNIAKVTIIGICLSIANMFRPGNTVLIYLSSFIGESLVQLQGVIAGSGKARPLFATYAGPPTPIWERLVSVSSLGLVMMCLPFGLLCFWKRYRFNALMLVFGIISLAYPAFQLFRFTTQGAELVDRSAPFLYIAIAAILAVFVVQFWPTRQLNWKRTAVLISGLSLVFLGAVLQASGPDNSLLPGPYGAIADSRSIEIQGIQAATWAKIYLGPNNRTAADRINQILMGTYGDQDILTSIQYKIDLSPVFLSTQFGLEDVMLLKSADARYLIVDMRLTKGLPVQGYYYESFEKGAYHHKSPINPLAFAKFDKVPGISKVFDDGNIIIYDVGGIVNAP